MPRVKPQPVKKEINLDPYFHQAEVYLRKKYDDPAGLKQKREYEQLIPIVALMIQNELKS